MSTLEQEPRANSNQEYQDRLNKLKSMVSAGINPYPAKTKKKQSVSKVMEKFSDLETAKKNVTLAGRLMSKREHGNLTFCNLQDGEGKMQIAFSKNEVGPEEYKKFLKFIDMGDFVEVSGVCFVTHKGEKSLMAKKWRILGKALRALPDKWHGLKNADELLRKRYLDLLLNQETKEIFVKKSLFWDVTRSFMKKHGFLEVETPTLETTTGGAEANPFRTKHNDFDMDVYLRISIGELWQKRLMAAGFEKTFEIGKAYRNEGSSPDHIQEFTNMEFYWAYADYKDGMKLTQKLYLEIAEKVFGTTKFQAKGMVFDLKDEWTEIDYQKEVMRQTGIDVTKATKEEMEAKLGELGVKYEGDNIERLTDSLWKYCRKRIAGPAFLVHHPKLVSPLAKEKEKNPSVVERFQIIIAGTEIGNGYSELNNPIEQRERFDIQKQLIESGDEEAMMPDYEFVEMLEYGMPPTCGFGFGERLFTVLMDKPIRETTLFPLVKPVQAIAPISANTKIVVAEMQDLGLDYGKAREIFDAHVKDNITRLHMIETEAVMRALAKRFNQDQEKWGIIGLLHDIDWEETKNDVKNHTVRAEGILKSAGASDFLINAVQSHCYGNPNCGEYGDRKRTTKLEHSLAAAETVTGLIIASALMQPDKKLASVKAESLMKKYRQKSFAANCDREIIREIEMAGMSLDEFMALGLEALQKIATELGL